MIKTEISTPQEHKLASEEVNELAIEDEKVDEHISAEREFATKIEKDNSINSKDKNDGFANSKEPKIKREARPQLLGGNYSYSLLFLE